MDMSGTKEKKMANGMNCKGISVFNGQVIIIRVSISGTPKESLTHLKDKIMDLTTLNPKIAEKGEPVHIFLDLSVFNAVSSTLFGTLGAAIQLEPIKTIGICGMKPAVRDAAKRLGIVFEEEKKGKPSKTLNKNIDKLKAFKSLETGLLELVPGGEAK
jgi:anti-anti-sigma regulatory factor